MAVATGATPTSTHFTLTEHYEIGDCLLEVVVNGIPSQPLTVTISKPVRRHGTPTTIVDVSH
jgi:hypothetical protein